MRFRHLHSMAPRDRMLALEEMFPVGQRATLFAQCAPGEYERLLRGIPGGLTSRWSDAMTQADRDAWFTYRKRTDIAKKKEDERLALLGPPLFAALSEKDYDLEELLALPRLLGDPIDEKGVRLYFLREAFPGAMRCYERVVKQDELVAFLKKQQFWGSAPFVALHDLPYGAERSNARVHAPRVFVADWDTKGGQEVPWELLRALPPHLVVKSGGGYHAYWAIPEDERQALGLLAWRRTNLALARALGSDPNVSLGSQIMRLPGSFHLKNPAEPRRVSVVSQHHTVVESIASQLCAAYDLVLGEEEYAAHSTQAVIDVDPEEHPALARVLEEMQEQGLLPQPDGRGWTFYCPCHEVSGHEPANVEKGLNAHFTVRQGSTPSGVLRVNEDKSLKLFCGSTGRCGAGPRAILIALGLAEELTWLECGGFLASEFGKKFKEAKIAAGTWEPTRAERAAARSAERRADKKSITSFGAAVAARLKSGDPI